MEKPNSLRAEIIKHLPELAENPDKLTMFISNGRIIAHKATLGHTTEFTLTILITDFTGDQNILRTVIIYWLQANQPDILQPGQTPNDAITFDADILSNDSVDLLIQLKLSERTTALIDDEHKIHISHPAEPQHINDLTGILGARWGKSENWKSLNE